jgi:hypothetical protein
MCLIFVCFESMSQLIQHRQIRFYLWSDWMFKLSSHWPEQCKALGIIPRYIVL